MSPTKGWKKTRAESGHSILSQGEWFNADVDIFELILIIQSIIHVRCNEMKALYVFETLFAF